MNAGNTISGLSKAILILAAILLATNIFLPIWKIELWAPQYPEGLALLIYANKLGGEVDIINGLNHYIGMQTLHSENFIEFSILRYIFGFFVLFILIAAFIGRLKVVNILFIAFVVFGVVAMVDFYRWNYNYGHRLDPTAAIRVPGMAYQPPLIGYKKLLNFGAYSIPDTGGILFITSVLLILLVIVIERKVFAKWFKRKSTSMALVLMMGSLSLISCSMPGPRPIKLNVDACSFCKMTISNAHFATQLTTHQGRNYVFDDMNCMVQFIKSNSAIEYDHYYVADYSSPADFVDVNQSVLLYSEELHSPMGGNIIGFAVPDSAKMYQPKLNATKVLWLNLIH